MTRMNLVAIAALAGGFFGLPAGSGLPGSLVRGDPIRPKCHI